MNGPEGSSLPDWTLLAAAVDEASAPEPVRKVIGDLEDTDRVLVRLRVPKDA